MNKIYIHYLGLFHKRFNIKLKRELYKGIFWKVQNDTRNDLINAVYHEFN